MSASTTMRPRATLTLNTSEGREVSIAFDVTTTPYNEAAAALGFPAEILRHLVAAGQLAGDKSVCDLDQARVLVEQLQAARAPVEGVPILISEAVRKYRFSNPSIYKWVKESWVTVMEREPKVKVNEGDLAFARALADLVGHTAGRAVFPPKPRPGRPKKPR